MRWSTYFFSPKWRLRCDIHPITCWNRHPFDRNGEWCGTGIMPLSTLLTVVLRYTPLPAFSKLIVILRPNHHEMTVNSLDVRRNVTSIEDCIHYEVWVTAAEVCERMIILIPHFTRNMITYLFWDYNSSVLAKGTFVPMATRKLLSDIPSHSVKSVAHMRHVQYQRLAKPALKLHMEK